MFAQFLISSINACLESKSFFFIFVKETENIKRNKIPLFKYKKNWLHNLKNVNFSNIFSKEHLQNVNTKLNNTMM